MNMTTMNCHTNSKNFIIVKKNIEDDEFDGFHSGYDEVEIGASFSD